MNKRFLYIPSFDTATAMNAGKKNYKLKDGTPWRYWEDGFPEEYRHNAFLITAGHNYKRKDHSKMYDFPKDMTVMGDSGGYQICSGAIEWDISFRDKILEWLQENSTVAINLDIPPRGKYQGRFNESLEISVDNFKYFADKQDGRTEFLNVLQGTTHAEIHQWYNAVKGLPFKGWSIGGAGGKLIILLQMISALIEHKEHLNPETKWIHVLGTSSVPEFLILTKLQRVINDLGLDVQITADSSTPNLGVAYGYYYIGFDTMSLKFKYIHFPRKEKFDFSTIQRTHLPIITSLDRRIWETFTLEEFSEWKSEHYGWLTAHNYTVFMDCYNFCDQIINGDRYILSQCISKDMLLILDSLDEMIKSSNPYSIYRKYLPIYTKVSRLSGVSEIAITSNDFF